MIRVVLAEDQDMVLGALAALLSLEEDIEVLAQTQNGKEALDACLRLEPDILITDIEMPVMTGLELTGEIQRSKLKTKVIIVTTFARSGYLRRALDTGARGYLLKDAPAADLAAAVRRVHSGGLAVEPQLATEAWTEPDPLTDRERQVLRMAGTGRTSAQIAEALFLSEGTVRNYLSEAIGKLSAGNRIEAAAIARHKGWL
jgi:two-component system response regulator DesR